jgi:hypothetical protein
MIDESVGVVSKVLCRHIVCDISLRKLFIRIVFSISYTPLLGIKIRHVLF